MRKDANLDAAVEAIPDLHAWRARALNGVMIAVIAAGLPLIVLTIAEATRRPEQWPAALTFLALCN